MPRGRGRPLQNQLISVVKLLVRAWTGRRTLLKSKTGVEPRLLAVRGPLKGHVIPLPQGEYWVGRQATNDLQLEDNAVSRRHCLFIRVGEGCTLKDLDSRNGTFVTGTPVTEQQLEPGDEIRIGGSVFCYHGGPRRRRRQRDKQTSVSSTRELRLEESLYLSSDEYTILPPSARALHDLRTLLRVSTMLHSFRGLHDTTSASAAEVLRSHLDIVAAGLDSGLARRHLYSRHRSGLGWLCRIRRCWSAPAGARGGLAGRRRKRRPCPYLAAPLIVRGEVAAVVYMESDDGEHRFDEGHLQLLTAVAGMAAVRLGERHHSRAGCRRKTNACNRN